MPSNLCISDRELPGSCTKQISVIFNWILFTLCSHRGLRVYENKLKYHCNAPIQTKLKWKFFFPNKVHIAVFGKQQSKKSLTHKNTYAYVVA